MTVPLLDADRSGATRQLPHQGGELVVERDPDTGLLTAVRGGGRNYVERLPGGVLRVGDLMDVVETVGSGWVRRHVAGPVGEWTEHYRWDDDERLCHVDGVDVDRDRMGRVTRCVSDVEDHDWRYVHDDAGVVAVETAGWTRRLTRDRSRRRVVASSIDGRRAVHAYDSKGRRTAVAGLPSTHHRDEAGRLWLVTGPDGRIRHTFLWDRYICLGRIDGPLGEPLAAAFSLDPTATPVRVVDRHGARRLPRDAYGEGLLGERGAPGLFGGAVHRGLVHLPHRVLDPALTTFCSPDPYDGGPDDPRRTSGYAGPLPTETDRGGPYTVCRDDPIARADPTGAMSGGGRLARLIISDLTWSLQNNLLTFFGMDYWFNFLTSLFTAFQFGDFASTSALGSGHLGSFGLRRGGILEGTGQVFTTQHIVWSAAADFRELREARVVDPGGVFEPTLYGSLLVGRPSESGSPFVLAGMAGRGGVVAGGDGRLWSRSGGPATSAAPGATVPKFPSGGFHIDATDPNPANSPTDPILRIEAPQGCRLVEADIGGTIGTGTLDLAGETVVFHDGLATFADGQLVFLADSDNDQVFATVKSNDAGRLRFVVGEDLSAIGPTAITVVQAAPAPLSSEARDAVAQVPNGFSAAGATATYAIGDFLRIVATGGEVTAAQVARFEARLPLDRPLAATTPSVVAPMTIRSTVAGTAVPATITTAGEVEFTAAVPTQQAGLVRAGGGELAVLVTGTPAGNRRTVDGDLTAVAAVGATVDWVPLTSGGTIGNRLDPPEAAAELTYRPAGAVPDGSAGGVVIRIESGAAAAVRSVTGAPVHDAVVADRAIAGDGPYQVERRQMQPGAVVGNVVEIRASSRLTVTPDGIVPDRSGGVLQLVLVAGDPPTVTSTPIVGAALNGAELTLVQPAATPASEPRPGQVVVLDPAGAAETATVRTVRVAATFDRLLDVDGGVVAVRLGPAGPSWRADVVTVRRVRLRPEVDDGSGTGTTIPVEFPRLRSGETVQVVPAGGGTPLGRYRIGSVTGTTVDLESDVDLPAGTATVDVQRLVPIDPRTGSELVARDGAAVGATPTDRIDFAVWRPDALVENTVVGVVGGGLTTPAVVTAVDQDLAVELAGVPVVGGPVDVGVLTALGTGYVAGHVADDGTYLVDDVDEGLTTDQPATLLVVPFLDTGDAARAVDGTLGGGTLLIPDDETQEVDRHQSLVDHELRHTQQYSWLGPLWFNLFPVWAVELGLEAGTNVDLPTYEPFVDAEVSAVAEPSLWRAVPDDASGFSSGNNIQLVQGGQFVAGEVVRVEAGEVFFKVDRGTAPPTGRLQMRRRNDSTGWDALYSVLVGTTHGGLLNYSWGTTYVQLLWLLAKGVYGLHRVRVGPGETHAATVEGDDRRRLRLTTEAGRAALNGAGVVTVHSGEDTVIRSRTAADDDGAVVVLDEAVPFDTTGVTVAPYDAHDPGEYFDWFEYVPARVEDPANPFEVTVLDGFEPGLAAGDRAEILYRTRETRRGKVKDLSFRAEVTSVAGRVVQLDDPVPLLDGEQSLRIARVGREDPMQSADTALLVHRGMGWLRWVFDPYGQIQIATDPEPGGFWDVIARIARYGLGTRSWGLLLFGYAWWDRLFKGDDTAHRAWIEQDASSKSGDLYSALGRLYGQAAEADGFAQRTMVVGDVARYWYWPNDRHGMLVDTTRQGAPGIHLDAGELRLLVNRTPTDANQPAASDTTVPTPARAVPDVFAAKASPDPTTLTGAGTGPAGLIPAGEGLIPLTATMQRSLGCYVAFTRPGPHRAVTRDGIRTGNAQDLHDREQHQTLFFDIAVSDVTVTVAGQPVAEGDTVTLVLTQSVVPAVTPAGDRQHALTVGGPTDDPVLQVAAGSLVAQRTAGAGEPVEVSRVYPDGAGGYPGGLDRHGTHLGGDVHVPVRQFTVDVVDTVPMRASVDPTTVAVASLAQGATGVLLVPATIVTPPVLASFDGRPPAAGDPAVTITALTVATDTDTARFLGPGGAAFQVTFATDPPLTSTVPVVLEIEVGSPGASATLTCTTDLTA